MGDTNFGTSWDVPGNLRNNLEDPGISQELMSYGQDHMGPYYMTGSIPGTSGDIPGNSKITWEYIGHPSMSQVHLGQVRRSHGSPRHL